MKFVQAEKTLLLNLNGKAQDFNCPENTSITWHWEGFELELSLWEKPCDKEKKQWQTSFERMSKLQNGLVSDILWNIYLMFVISFFEVYDL